MEPFILFFGLDQKDVPGSFLGSISCEESKYFPFLLEISLLIRFLGSFLKDSCSDNSDVIFWLVVFPFLFYFSVSGLIRQ